MAKVRNWHKLESKAKLHELQPISVVWGGKSIKVIIREGGKKLNIILDKDEAAVLVTRLTSGIHRIK